MVWREFWLFVRKIYIFIIPYSEMKFLNLFSNNILTDKFPCVIFCFETSTTRNSLIRVSKFQVRVIEEEVEPFLRTKNSFSVNQIQCQPTKRGRKKLVNSYFGTGTPKFNFKDGKPWSFSNSLSDLKSFGRHVMESSSSKAPANVGRCIMNLIRMKSEFYHNISPCYANLSQLYRPHLENYFLKRRHSLFPRMCYFLILFFVLILIRINWLENVKIMIKLWEMVKKIINRERFYKIMMYMSS